MKENTHFNDKIENTNNTEGVLYIIPTPVR